MRKNNRDASREGLMDDRRARVASFRVRGLSIRQIVAALARAGCVNPDTRKPWAVSAIHADLEHLTAKWQAQALRDTSQLKANELLKLDEAEREAWAAWHRSIGRHQVRTTKTGRVDKEGVLISTPEVSLKTEPLAGDPRYLAVVLDCQRHRAELLGLDAPQKIAATTADGEDIFNQDARTTLYAKLLG